MVREEELVFTYWTGLKASVAGSMPNAKPVTFVAFGAESISQTEDSLVLSEKVTLETMEALLGAASPM